MGTGKTTVGRAVAHRIGFKCVDSDHEIERKAGKPVAEIFAEDGEARVPGRWSAGSSRRATRPSASWSPAAAAWSCSPGMLELLGDKGVVVCLHASIETILARTGRHGKTRPLLDVEDPDARARALYAEREAIYRSAGTVILTDSRPAERDRGACRSGSGAANPRISSRGRASGRSLRPWRPARRSCGARLGELGFDEVRFVRPCRGSRGRRPCAPGSTRATTRTWTGWSGLRRSGWTRDSSSTGARSAILLGVNYFQGGGGEGPDGRAGLGPLQPLPGLPRFAQAGAGARRRARSRRSAGPGPATTATTSTPGPVLERAWAARAGVGFIGKNAMLISRRHGNWLFLAAILTRLDLEPDPPLSGRGDPGAVGLLCGKCTRCLDACPTQAFPAPGVVDARRCISYQTIENRGIIPRELRPAIGRPGLRVRHLPRRLPLEPVRGRGAAG